MKSGSIIKADKNIKAKAEKIATKLGVPLEFVVNAFLKQFIETKELHLSVVYKMTPYLERLVGQAEKDWKAGKNISPLFSSAEEANRWLDAA
jgi:antitoxin component of RelBE/YafQ-DinJ toxin-antitoxin module